MIDPVSITLLVISTGAELLKATTRKVHYDIPLLATNIEMDDWLADKAQHIENVTIKNLEKEILKEKTVGNLPRVWQLEDELNQERLWIRAFNNVRQQISSYVAEERRLRDERIERERQEKLAKELAVASAIQNAISGEGTNGNLIYIIIALAVLVFILIVFWLTA